MEERTCNQLTDEMRNKYIKINCGGTLHFTTIDTLTKRNDTMLSSMFSGRIKIEVDSEGWILIDRCGKHFGTILNYLRDGTFVLPKCPTEIAELLAEAKYYCIADLVSSCELSIFEECKHKCQIPLIATEEDMQILVKRSLKPIVVLTVTNLDKKLNNLQVEVSILRNIELFEKLALQYNNQILFIKKVGKFVNYEEACYWAVYKEGEKIELINCITNTSQYRSIHVEYDEARIYEAVLKAMSFASNEDKNYFGSSIVKFFKSNSSPCVIYCFSLGVLAYCVLRPIVKNNLFYRY